jgi:acyl-CoA dehydrogenase
VRGGGHCTLVATGAAQDKAGKSMLAVIPNRLERMTSSVYKDMGRMGLSTGGFIYKGSEVPEKYLLGEEGKGFYICMEGFNVARAVVAAACLGGAQGCLEISADYVRQRAAFGKTIGTYQGISFEMAEDWCRLEAAKLMLQKGCWMIDKYYSEPGSITQKEINPIIAYNKWWAPFIGADISQHAMMYHGAFGYTKDCPLEMAHRGVLSYVVGAEGTPNIMKLIIGRDIFDLRG